MDYNRLIGSTGLLGWRYQPFRVLCVYLCFISSSSFSKLVDVFVAGSHQCEGDVEIMRENTHAIDEENDEMTLKMTMDDRGDKQNAVVNRLNLAKHQTN